MVSGMAEIRGCKTSVAGSLQNTACDENATKKSKWKKSSSSKVPNDSPKPRQVPPSTLHHQTDRLFRGKRRRRPNPRRRFCPPLIVTNASNSFSKQCANQWQQSKPVTSLPSSLSWTITQGEKAKITDSISHNTVHAE
jgi:hypothetical protein